MVRLLDLCPKKPPKNPPKTVPLFRLRTLKVLKMAQGNLKKIPSVIKNKYCPDKLIFDVFLIFHFHVQLHVVFFGFFLPVFKKKQQKKKYIARVMDL